jgi:tRNA threonylcarbamoyladenosine biosynthesis protein TsaE
MVISLKKVYFTSNNLETIELGKTLGCILKPNDVVLLIGDLSAGKTTFTKGVGLALGVSRVINSPTFTIVKEYKGTELKLYHLDLYRLDGVNNDFDLEEYFNAGGISIIEWPYQVSEILPDEYILVNIERLSEEERKITFEGVGAKYCNLFEE